ncbi:beta-N-acetylglucosaminidase domain-containing protein [Desertihabitans aurantiacus]|uniref:beta-N-acetylglucosaminidase domain-containing protein n=1 Tax=Desertihabitans aurantiacus TaxID=2282477 RepID=UPI0018E58176|nr:beta-N-acetylglucosaminidase domain-containing protein [Desertihabitans aurantiacus]
MRRRRLLPTATLTATGLVAALVLAWTPPAAPAAAVPELPVVSPTPQQMTREGRDLVLTPRARVVTDAGTDPAARDLLVEALQQADVTVDVGPDPRRGGTTFLLGDADRPDVAAALGDVAVPEQAEGYALRVSPRGGPTVALGGVDGAGQYYAVQTLRQLIEPERGRARIAGVAVSDFPSMPLRGTIEGFYGEPWTPAERLDQMAFHGDLKANTYIYAPKDDPYHRERWREPYPAEQLAGLRELVGAATDHHVRFTFALSPGNTVCYSSEDDYRALVAKLQEMYDIGVRAFSVPLDDIAYGQWNCAADEEEFGAAGPGAAGRAQTELLDRIQTEFIETHEGAHPLQMVPTEYYDTVDSPYKAALRTLDEDVVVMWTGEGVVPPEVTVEQADAADAAFGGQVFLWDNYPVNDYGQSSGRLLLAPYAEREAGLSEHLVGIVSNPMNQASASKVAVFGIFDFTWNDRDYDPATSWEQAMRHLAGDDPATVEALLLFGDLNHLAPSFGDPWQPQAPVLQQHVERFWQRWDAGERAAAVADLRARAEEMAAAPQTIRAGVVDPMFVSDAAPWLTATERWAAATLTMLDALDARLAGDADAAAALVERSAQAQQQAAAVLVDPPDNRWGRAPVKIADGVLDRFLVEAALTLQLWELGEAENVAPAGTATASSVEQDLDRLDVRFVNDGDLNTRWASGYTDTEWVQVELAEPTVVSAVTLHWEAACAEAYALQTSTDGQTWTTVREVSDSTCALDVLELDGSEPVRFVRMQGVQRVGDWGYSLYELGVYTAR